MPRIFAAIGLMMLLSGCVDLKGPGDVEAVAKTAYAAVAAGDLAALKAVSGPQLQAQETQAILDQMRAQIPNEKSTADITNFWRINTSTGVGTQAEVQRTYSYPSGQVMCDAVLQKGGGKSWVLIGIHVQRGQKPPGAGP